MSKVSKWLPLKEAILSIAPHDVIAAGSRKIITDAIESGALEAIGIKGGGGIKREVIQSAQMLNVIDTLIANDSIFISDMPEGGFWDVKVNRAQLAILIKNLAEPTQVLRGPRGRSSAKGAIHEAMAKIPKDDLMSMRIEKEGLLERVTALCGHKLGDRNYSPKAVGRHISSYLANMERDKITT